MYAREISGDGLANESISRPGNSGARTIWTAPLSFVFSDSTLVFDIWSPTHTLQASAGNWIIKSSSSTSTAPPYHFLGSFAPGIRSYWYIFLVVRLDEVTVSKQNVPTSPRWISSGSLLSRSRKAA